MPKSKNLKHHLKEGDLIRTPQDVYEVLLCGEKDFQCKTIFDAQSEWNSVHEFDYTTEMIIYREYTRN